MATNEKTAPAEQRALKKAARRAAFIQEVAKAVRLAVCGPSTEGGPFAQAFYKQDMAAWRAGKVREAEANGLRWAIEQGLLPASAYELPDEQTQYCLLLKMTATPECPQ